MQNKKELNNTFWKLKTFLDLCKNKPKNKFDIIEIFSMFYSNFEGNEIIKFRNAQSQNKKFTSKR